MFEGVSYSNNKPKYEVNKTIDRVENCVFVPEKCSTLTTLKPLMV